MKKIISTQGLISGTFDAPLTNRAIHERIDNRLVDAYRENYCDDIQVIPAFKYQLADGQVTAIELIYSVAHPTPQRLEDFRENCENFFDLYGFKIDHHSPRVYFRAVDIFDMASLIHALVHLTVCIEDLLCAVDADLTERDAIYSPSGAYIIQIPDVPHYIIQEGTLYISPMAARHCTKLQKLDVPAEMLFDNTSLQVYPQGLKVKVWETHYDGTPIEEEY